MFKEFQAFAETQSKHKIQVLQGMKRQDFISKDLEAIFMEQRMESTLQSIGPTKCANQIVNAMAKYMLEPQKLEKSLWTEAMANAICTLN